MMRWGAAASGSFNTAVETLAGSAEFQRVVETGPPLHYSGTGIF